MSEERPVEVSLLAKFSPLDGMKKENQAALARKVVVRSMDAGRLLFKEGDKDKRTIWLVSEIGRASCRERV